MRKGATSPGIAGNDLNRCDVPALQRKDLERRLKEQLYSFADSRVMAGWKFVVFGVEKDCFG